MNPNKFHNHPSILQHTALTIEEGLRPYRFVLRDLARTEDLSITRKIAEHSSRYVVHRENMELIEGVWEHAEFYWGHYFSALSMAELFFNNKEYK